MKRAHVNGAVAIALALSGVVALTHDPEGVSGTEQASLAAVAAPTYTPFATAAENAKAHELVSNMSLAQKAGQVIVATYDGYGSPADDVRTYHFGGVIPVSDNIQSAEQIGRVVRSIRRAVSPRGYPAFVGIDQEGGRVTRIGTGPSLMTAGAANRPALTTELARTMGLEMRGLGFTAVMAPVADVTVGPKDPTIGTRSVGSRPGLVATHVRAAMQGLISAGVIPTLKHFPGHGSVGTDTHIDLAVQQRSLTELRKKDLAGFRQAIDAGAPAVMTGHIDVRAVDPGVPASLSWKITTGLLRRELGFRGLVVTDSLGMGAITRRYSSATAAVRALKAGADVLLMPPDARAARYAIVQAVRSGQLSVARLDQAATRMVATLLHQQRVAPRGAPIGASTAAHAAITRDGLTQVTGACTGALVSPQIRVTGPYSRIFATIAKAEGLRVGSTGHLVALATTRVPGRAHVAVALERPHLLGAADARHKLAAYGTSGPALRAVVRRLMGKSVAPGHLPTSAGVVPRSGC